MIWNEFSKKLPDIGSNIVFISDDGMIGIIEVTIDLRIHLKTNCCDPFLVEFTDDKTTVEYDISCAKRWLYPSQIKRKSR